MINSCIGYFGKGIIQLSILEGDGFKLIPFNPNLNIDCDKGPNIRSIKS